MCDFPLTARHQLCVLVPSAGLGDSCSVAGCAAWHSGLQTRLVRRELIPAALRGSARGGGRRGDRQLLLGALSKLWQWGDHSTASRDLSSSPAPARGGAGRSRPSPQPSAPPAPRGTRGNDHGRDWSASKRHRERLTAGRTRAQGGPAARLLCCTCSVPCSQTEDPATSGWARAPRDPGTRGPLCTESLFVPRPAPGQVSRSHTFRFSHVLTESRPPVQGAAARTLSPRSQKARTPGPRGAAAAGGHRLRRVRSWAAARQPSGKTRLEARTLLDLDVKATKAGHLENKVDVNFQAEWVASGSPALEPLSQGPPALPRLWKGGQRSTWKAKPPPLTHTVLSSTQP